MLKLRRSEGGISIMVVRDLPKVKARVRFPYPAPFYALAENGPA